jgi:hypothetical protein
MDRTTEYERHLDTIKNLRGEALAAGTLARAFDDYAELIGQTTFGAVADQARDSVVHFCQGQADRCRTMKVEMTERANSMETNGMP